MFSGLTLGYFSLDPNTLRRRARLGDKEAKAVYPIRKKGNLLLTTLLLGNVAVNTALSVYIGSLVSGLIARIIATTLIFLLGEIIPQAAFSRHALWFGSTFAPVMRVLLVIMLPITFPIAYLLDRFLGQEIPTVFSKHELMHLVSELEDSEHSDLDEDEERIIHGALQFSHTTVREVMTPKDKVVSFEENQRINDAFITELGESAYSRYPIYSGNEENIVGILFTRDLLGEDEDITINETKTAFERSFLKVRSEEKLDVVLGRMLKRYQHLGIVMTRNDQYLGVVSLEDIIEEIIQTEIEDEDERA